MKGLYWAGEVIDYSYNNSTEENEMSWIADAHSQWHTAHGWDQVCPLDCGIGEGQDDYDQEEPTAEMIAEAEAWKVAQEEEWSSLTWV